ncbi:hypothetical protein TSUD_155840 [Trifolium subterraneum]|uniref:Uncharacterized protein n=1 Tax=Trifolium subterraneum TaxID=3900 RepID=A0A2Z6NW91_TRISU|nr:hypothetical protein TSUD_155840 [Trifolium subterraneum]
MPLWVSPESDAGSEASVNQELHQPSRPAAPIDGSASTMASFASMVFTFLPVSVFLTRGVSGFTTSYGLLAHSTIVFKAPTLTIIKSLNQD